MRVTDFQEFSWLLKEPALEGLDLLSCPKMISTTVHIFIPTWYVNQGSNLKKFLSRLLATIEEKMVAKCKKCSRQIVQEQKLKKFSGLSTKCYARDHHAKAAV